MSVALTCPLCKAANEFGPNCRRCKADLAELFAIEQERSSLLARVGQAFASGSFEEARIWATRADSLRRGADSQRWLAVLNLLSHNYTEAWRAYRGAVEHG